MSVSKPAKTPILWVEQKDLDGILSFINHQDTSRLSVSVMGELEEKRTTYILNRGAYDAPTTPVEAATPTSILAYSNSYEKIA